MIAASLNRRLALTATGLLLLVAGCGGGSHESSAEEEAKAKAGIRRTCLERRESRGISGPPFEDICREVGVTASSPPPNSREAEAAAQRAKESGQRIEEEIAEEPDFEMLRRSAAAVDLAKGDRAVAERELKEGCPKADAEELSDALSELEAFSPAATGSVKEGGEELEELLEDICPL